MYERAQAVAALVEENSLRNTFRMTGIHRTTIQNLLSRLGVACLAYQDEVFKDLPLQGSDGWGRSMKIESVSFSASRFSFLERSRAALKYLKTPLPPPQSLRPSTFDLDPPPIPPLKIRA